MRMPEWSRWCCLSVVALAAGACGRREEARIAAATEYDCPNHDDPIRIPVETGRIGYREIDSLPVPGALTKVSEYHDCQKLVSGHAGYGPLVGIWVSQNAGTIFRRGVSGSRGADTAGTVAQAAVPLMGQVIAQLFDWGEAYPALKIAPGFNCLYLWPKNPAQTSWGAKMVSQPTENCAASYPVSPADGDLRVTPVMVPHADLDGTDVPAVARWDWDPKNEVQYIGIACGDRWCEVSGDRLVASRRFGVNDGPAQEPVPNHPPKKPAGKHKRVWMIKGWYDEQYIAVAGGTKGDLTPGGVLATIFPHGQLDELNSVSDFQAGWVPAATVRLDSAMPSYEVKSNFTPKDNRIFLCENGKGNCGDAIGQTPKECTASQGGTWFAKIVSGRGVTKYRCVTRREHNDVVATARWRWLNNDETVWIRCANGCCTLS